jgi:hypothetical protein
MEPGKAWSTGWTGSRRKGMGKVREERMICAFYVSGTVLGV